MADPRYTATATAAVSVEKPALSRDRVDSIMKDSTTGTTSGDGVRILRLDEWEPAARSIAEAFRHDEVSRYFIDTPDRADWSEEQKWDLHVKIMEYITYAHLLSGLVVCAGPDYDCVALW